jgi:RimJ/RimL family protein N-acetyltransferase
MEPKTLPPALAPGVAPPQRIETDGLLLRRWEPQDVQPSLDAINASFEQLHAWMDWLPEPRTLEEHQEWFQRQFESWPAKVSYNYGIFDAVDGTLLGTIGYHDRIGPGALEIGYWCHVAHTGKGVITRAARELTRIALGLDGIERVEIHCDEANVRSAAVPRRLGYRLDRIEEGAIAAPAESGRDMIWIKERDKESAADAAEVG